MKFEKKSGNSDHGQFGSVPPKCLKIWKMSGNLDSGNLETNCSVSRPIVQRHKKDQARTTWTARNRQTRGMAQKAWRALWFKGTRWSGITISRIAYCAKKGSKFWLKIKSESENFSKILSESEAKRMKISKAKAKRSENFSQKAKKSENFPKILYFIN